VQTDAIYTEGKDTTSASYTLWDNAGRITNDGYIVSFRFVQELTILEFPEQTWDWPFIG